MHQHFSSSYPLRWVQLQHLLKQIHSFRVNYPVLSRLQIKPHLFVVVVHFFEFTASEKRTIGQEDMEDGSQRKDVAHWRYFLSFFKSTNLGSDIPRGPTSIENVIIPRHICCQPEVDDHRIQLIPHHDILGLDVSVHDVLLVQFFDAPDHP